jgi:hypothetical protein
MREGYRHTRLPRPRAIIAWLLVIVLCLTLVACGGDDDDDSGGVASPSGTFATPSTTPDATAPGATPANGTPIGTPEDEAEATMPADDDLPPPVQRAVRMAAEDHGVAIDDIELLGFERVEWSDSSLGCPQPGMFYAQVIVPGYLIRVDVQGATYEYHTDTSNQIVSC